MADFRIGIYHTDDVYTHELYNDSDAGQKEVIGAEDVAEEHYPFSDDFDDAIWGCRENTCIYKSLKDISLHVNLTALASVCDNSYACKPDLNSPQACGGRILSEANKFNSTSKRELEDWYAPTNTSLELLKFNPFSFCIMIINFNVSVVSVDNNFCACPRSYIAIISRLAQSFFSRTYKTLYDVCSDSQSQVGVLYPQKLPLSCHK